MSGPMTEERWKEIRHTATMYGNDALSEEDFNAVLDEITRLRTLPPEVAEAMEEYKRERHVGGYTQWIEVIQQKSQAAVTIAAHFAALFHPTPTKVQP